MSFEKAYERFEYKMIRQYEPIWDSESEKNDFSYIRALVDEGTSFRVGVLSQENIWYFNLVDLVFCFDKKDEFEVKTISESYCEPMIINHKKYESYQVSKTV